MPVSRKRKKSKPGNKPPRPAPITFNSTVPELRSAGPANAWDQLMEHRRQLSARRAKLADRHAEELVDELLAIAPGRSDADVEDELGTRFGVRMAEVDQGAPDDSYRPAVLAEAILLAADRRLRESLAEGADSTASWRLLTVVAGLMPPELVGEAHDLVTAHLAASTELAAPAERRVTGPALWARDAYGSRWVVVAPFSSPSGPDRWYLWDVDACAYDVAIVYSGYFPSAELALASWRAAVGETAAGDAVLTPVDDSYLLDSLLIREEGFFRMGGENEALYAEYLRGQRLASAVYEAVGAVRADRTTLDTEEAAAEFESWMRTHRTPPDDFEEIATELASSWSPNDDPVLYPACSPHKVALTVLHMRDYYQDEFATELVTWLPDWISWLAQRNGTPAELAERCMAYASGKPFPGITSDNGQPNYRARVTE